MTQPYDAMLQERTEIIHSWEKSEEYRQGCAYLKEEYARLYNIGQAYCFADMEDSFRKRIVRTEAASYGGLHRGFYCPNLLEYIVVGNAKRGKIKKRITSKTKDYFLYGFDQDDRLILSDMYYTGNRAEMEFLFYEKDYVYGITLSPDKEIVRITEEQYDQNRLTHYAAAYFFQKNCWQIYRDDYVYDSNGLYCCTHQIYLSAKDLYQKNIRTFERENGYLTRYTSVCAPFDKHPEAGEESVYNVRIRWKA